jgi:hypothetical protein
VAIGAVAGACRATADAGPNGADVDARPPRPDFDRLRRVAPGHLRRIPLAAARLRRQPFNQRRALLAASIG